MESELNLDQFNPVYPRLPAFRPVPPVQASRRSSNNVVIASPPAASTPGFMSTVASAQALTGSEENLATRVPSWTPNSTHHPLVHPDSTHPP